MENESNEHSFKPSFPFLSPYNNTFCSEKPLLSQQALRNTKALGSRQELKRGIHNIWEALCGSIGFYTTAAVVF